MWHIDNPLKVYKDLYKVTDENKFTLACIMRHDKYHSLPNADRKIIENNKNINIENIKIKNPDNPAQLIEAKLISLEVL